ncbi:MAG: SRPBCC domain-containing protein [Pseudomonadota bacterium]
MPAPVIKTVDVPCSPDIAFRIFTQDLSHWWPKDKHSVSAMTGAPARSVSLEARAGGTISEVAADGTHHHWGSVSVYDPYRRFGLLWHIGQPVEKATRVDVLFEPTEDGTRVTLTHSGWEVLGGDAAKSRDGYDSGWVHVFETCFARACATTVPS